MGYTDLHSCLGSHHVSGCCLTQNIRQGIHCHPMISKPGFCDSTLFWRCGRMYLEHIFGESDHFKSLLIYPWLFRSSEGRWDLFYKVAIPTLRICQTILSSWLVANSHNAMTTPHIKGISCICHHTFTKWHNKGWGETIYSGKQQDNGGVMCWSCTEHWKMA